MSDVWEFKNGVIRIVEMENLGGRRPQLLLVYLQTEELIISHQMLEDRLRDEGWVHYPEMSPELIEYHRGPDDNYLISLPRDISMWEFKNGVTRKVENPGGRRALKVLVYLPTTEVITSHQMLQNMLREEVVDALPPHATGTHPVSQGSPFQ
ncbi:hypothetical protein ZIOFF_031521 [Zingiber officinale]|uniref:Uncharacterized protein n=1 Tax=Zingiber officinale TaxID=94328 RepID=A0A8J5GU06_ZINOF|nr:hypothetical protein ZIOFF_031521 [Zingiber officinale]